MSRQKPNEEHMHWKALHDSDYLYAHDLQGKEATLTIVRVTGGELTGQGGKKTRKPLVYFKEPKSGKPLAFNKTNCKTVAALYGNDTDDWIGKRIIIYPTKTQFGNEEHDCIRVRPKVPPNGKGAPMPAEQSDAGDPPPPEPGSDG